MSARLASAVGRLGGLVARRSTPEPLPTPQPVRRTTVSRRPPRPDGTLVCVVGDKIADTGAAPVVSGALADLLEDDVHLLVAASDKDLAGAIFSDTTYLTWLPDDTADDAATYLNYWSPDVVVLIGTPQAANLVEVAAKQGIPIFHAAPERTKEKQRLPAYLKHAQTCLAASAADAEAMRQQFSDQPMTIETAGPLSDTVAAPECDDAECDALAKLLGGRPVWLAASVGQSEIVMIERAHRKAFRAAHRLLLILSPAEPDQAGQIVEQLEAEGWQTGLRSRGDLPDPDVQIYVADTPGDMGLWYRLAPSTFVGGTFMPTLDPGDPFSPAALGSAVLHGPHTGKAPARFKRLEAHGASLLVTNVEELGEAVVALLSPDKAAALAQAGWATTTESAHVVERLAELMLDALDAREATR